MIESSTQFDLQWRRRLISAVSPLGSGVGGLRVNGYRPPGQSAYRPNRTAAVLVPVLARDEPEVVLTRRAEHLPHHPGQVSFPGGAAEKHDTSAVHTAMREAHEEIGLPAECTHPIGFLDRMDTISDYRVLPVVALVQWPVSWRLDTREVAEVFTVPLAVAMDRSKYTSQILKRDGREHAIWTLQWENQTIWGATASILLNLASRLERQDAT